MTDPAPPRPDRGAAPTPTSPPAAAEAARAPASPDAAAEAAPAPASPAAARERPLRLFVALDLPDPVRDALAVLAAAADPDVWRPLGRDALHVTLAFLGPRPPAAVAAIAPLLAGGPAPPLALAEAEVLPPRRGRVLVARVDDPTRALSAMQARLSAALAAAGLYTPEKRAFHAHATVARLRPRAKPARTAGVALERLEFRPDAVTLYASRLHPSGARYEPLARAPLISP
jgi:2'-5' RNA ligase